MDRAAAGGDGRTPRDALTELVAGGMRPAVSEVHELEDVGTALQRVADRLPTGKVVIRVAP